MKVALVYDRINKWGGAESVLLALHEIFPDAPLYTSVYKKETAPWADCFDIHTSILQKLPLPKTKHEYYPFLMGPAFETFNFDSFDLVISVTHEFAKAIITKPITTHICYCLTPVSYLWSGTENYFGNGLKKNLISPVLSYLRFYDRIISRRPDHYIAISETVKDRIKDFYGLESSIVYPPVNIGTMSGKSINEDFFLIVSRLVPNKRLDLAVKAFSNMGTKLKIIGAGREEKYLKAISGKNIEFLGYLTDDEVATYYRSCRGLIVPGVEDFGITAVEAQSFGKPVIAFRKGGLTETVIEGKTGFFFEKQTAESIATLMKSLDLSKINPSNCRLNAEKYSKNNFKSKFKKEIERLYALRPA